MSTQHSSSGLHCVSRYTGASSFDIHGHLRSEGGAGLNQWLVVCRRMVFAPLSCGIEISRHQKVELGELDRKDEACGGECGDNNISKHITIDTSNCTRVLGHSSHLRCTSYAIIGCSNLGRIGK